MKKLGRKTKNKTMKRIHIKDIKKDQIFYEIEYGAEIKVIALEDAYESGKMDGKYTQWKCAAKQIGVAAETEEFIDYLVTERHEHYGPKLYVEEPIILDKYKGLILHKLTKLSTINENPNGVNDNYWVAGVIVQGPAVGKSFVMSRIANSLHPEGREGIFRTSEVIEINGDEFKTRNSVYKLELIQEGIKSNLFEGFYKKCEELGIDPFGDKE